MKQGLQADAMLKPALAHKMDLTLEYTSSGNAFLVFVYSLLSWCSVVDVDNGKSGPTADETNQQ